jgi:hypothetical protein
MSPYQMITGKALDEFKFTFGDLLAVSVPVNDKTREWKFDMKNQMGIYCGQPGVIGASLVY